jgi:hypothetical protein
MSDSNLNVKITADIAQMTAQFAVAQANVRSLTSEVNKLAKASAAGTIDAAGQQQLQQFAGNLVAAKNRAAELREELKATQTKSGDFGSSLEGVRSKLSQAFAVTGLAVAAEGVMKLGEEITKLGDRAIQIRTMSMVLGITTDQFQAMAVAGDEAGVSAEVFARASEHLTNLLTEARNGSGKAVEKLHELGITSADIANKTFQLNEVLAVLKQRLEDTNSAEATRKALLTDLGARTALAIQAIKEYDGSQQGVSGAMAKVNALSGAQIDRLAQMKIAWSELATGAQNAVAKLVAGAGDALNAYKKAVLAKNPQLAPEVTSQTTGGSVRGTIDRSGSGGADQQAAKESARTQEAAHNEILRSEMASIKAGVAAFAQGTAERLAALRQYAAVAKQYFGSGNIDEVRQANEQVLFAEREYRATQGREAIADAKTQAEALQANTSLSLSQRLEAERAIWSSVLANDKLSNAQRLEAAREFSREYTENAKQTAAQIAAIARSDVSTDIAIAKLTLDARRSALDAEVAAGKMAASQKLATLRQLTAEEFSLNEKELEDELKALNEGTAEYARAYNQIRELKAKLVTDLAKLDQQNAADVKREAEQEVTSRKLATNEILNAEGTLVNNVIGKRKTMGATVVQIAQQFALQEITNDLKAVTMRLLISNTEEARKKALEQGGLIYHQLVETQKTAASVTGQTAQTAAQVSGDTTRLTSQASAAAASKAVSATTGAAQIQADAAKAAAGAYSAVASIPYVGPILAPVAATVAYGAVAAYGTMASLDTGTNYVPRNMVAQIHEGERIVPKKFNPDANGGRGKGSGAGDMHVHMGPSMGARDVQRSLKQGGALQKTLREMHRKGVRG